MAKPEYLDVTVNVEMIIRVPYQDNTRAVLMEAAEVANNCVDGNVAQLEDWTVQSPDDLHVSLPVNVLTLRDARLGDEHAPQAGNSVMDVDDDPDNIDDWLPIEKVIGEEGDGTWRVVLASNMPDPYECVVLWSQDLGCWSAV